MTCGDDTVDSHLFLWKKSDRPDRTIINRPIERLANEEEKKYFSIYGE